MDQHPSVMDGDVPSPRVESFAGNQPRMGGVSVNYKFK